MTNLPFQTLFLIPTIVVNYSYKKGRREYRLTSQRSPLRESEYKRDDYPRYHAGFLHTIYLMR